jgi:3-oxoacyl-[acyl-carrier protein] reductase
MSEADFDAVIAVNLKDVFNVWARELGRRGITINAIAPSFIATEMTQGMPEQALKGMVEHRPVGRIGQPRSVDGGLVIGA